MHTILSPVSNGCTHCKVQSWNETLKKKKRYPSISKHEEKRFSEREKGLW